MSIIAYKLMGKTLEVGKLASGLASLCSCSSKRSSACHRWLHRSTLQLRSIEGKKMENYGALTSNPSHAGAINARSCCSSRLKSGSLSQPKYPSTLSLARIGPFTGDTGSAGMTLPVHMMAPPGRTEGWCERWWLGLWRSLAIAASLWIDVSVAANALPWLATKLAM